MNLLLFYMMISGRRIIEKDGDSNALLKFFEKRCTDARFSNLWKLLFYSLRYIQSLVLIMLFIKGMSNINNLKNLGYMFFFIVYTAYLEAFRKTSVLLVLFNSGFIIGQYIFSFVYPLTSIE
jgi:hypothetical protein